jgi:hypothetical protein
MSAETVIDLNTYCGAAGDDAAWPLRFVSRTTGLPIDLTGSTVTLSVAAAPGTAELAYTDVTSHSHADNGETTVTLTAAQVLALGVGVFTGCYVTVTSTTPTRRTMFRAVLTIHQGVA